MKSIMQIYKTKKLINTFKHFMKTVFDSYRCPFKKVCDTTQLCLDGRLTCHNGENLDNQFPRTEPRISNWLQLKQSLISGKVQKVQILVFLPLALCPINSPTVNLLRGNFSQHHGLGQRRGKNYIRIISAKKSDCKFIVKTLLPIFNFCVRVKY